MSAAVDDKTLLFRGWSITKLGLCVKGKGITIYGGLGLSYVKKVCACPPSRAQASFRIPELGSGRVISSSSIKDKIFIFPWHLGHAPLNITVDSSNPLAGMAGIVSIPEYLKQLFYGTRERVCRIFDFRFQIADFNLPSFFGIPLMSREVPGYKE